jgi:hypothetical protein
MCTKLCFCDTATTLIQCYNNDMRYLKIAVAVLGIVVAVIVPHTANATVNDFVFTSFTADYTLGKDANNRSSLQVKETLVAQFPNYNQNHGIERAIPNVYDNHPVNLGNITVTKQDGSPWNFSTYENNDNTVLRIGDADSYVQGTQYYIIQYSLNDVTKNFTDGDEFYWDINGTEWLQPFATVSATLRLDDGLADSLDGRLACYSGAAGSTDTSCTIQNNQNTITVQSTQPLAQSENLSMIVGFAPNTFSPYVAPPLPWWVWVFLFAIVPIFYIAVPIYILVWAIKRWRKQGRDTTRQSTIVPEYIPPKDSSMPLNDVIIYTAMRPSAVSATIIDLAVRHYLKIYQTTDKDYELEIVASPSSLRQEENRVIDILFKDTAIGSRIALQKLSSVYSEVTELGKEVYDLAIANNLLVDTKGIQKKMYIVGGVALFISFFSINILLLIAAIAVLAFAAQMPARTQKGVALKTYLDGTKMYMEVAEAERLKTLQSPTGVTKVDVSDTVQLVKLYERLLPLAMLYGIEKDWAKQFSHLYSQENQPDWFVGNYSAFSTGAFVGAIAGFGTTATSSFSPPASSGSSGFSGGGSSGGGGGGGGGGGW